VIVESETQSRIETPDTIDVTLESSCLVMTGDLYQVHATVRSDAQSRHTNSNFAGLDTCGGCNLIRADQVPYGAQIVEMSRGPKVTAAQGQSLPIIGALKLLFRLEG
jgi:hypothetical protein